MGLQHPIDIYRRKGDCVIDWMHTSFYTGAIDGTNLFSYRSHMKKPLPLSPRVVFVIYWTFKYIVSFSLGVVGDIGAWAGTSSATSLCWLVVPIYYLRCPTLMSFSAK